MFELQMNEALINQNPRVVVIGVGGGGCNAVNEMIAQGIEDVEYVVVNTDARALATSQAPVRIQIGKNLLGGLGAGAKPELGKSAFEEDKKELEPYLENADMVFLTCGLGGGTGTGAIAPIAAMCKSYNILTVAVVTTPFTMEGFVRNANSKQGLELLSQEVDTLLVIPNDKLLNENYQEYSFEDCLKLADRVLVDGVSSICNIIFKDGMINIDFGDVHTIMEQTGLAHIGIGKSKRAGGLMDAIKAAATSPLMDTDIRGAKKIIFNCSGKCNMQEMQQAMAYISELTSKEANIIMGTVGTSTESDEITVTLIATDLQNVEPQQEESSEIKPTAPWSNFGSQQTVQLTGVIDTTSAGSSTESASENGGQKIKFNYTEKEIVIPPFLRRQ